LRYEMTIPDGSRARVTLPLDPGQRIALVRNQESNEPVDTGDLQSGSFILGAGRYYITISPAPVTGWQIFDEYKPYEKDCIWFGTLYSAGYFGVIGTEEI